MVQRTTLTTAEVAKICEVDQKSVWQWCQTGKGPRHTKTRGGHFRFERTEVANWLARNDMRVPDELRPFLETEFLTKEELRTAVDVMSHADRVALLAEYHRWLAVRAS